jgi:malate/lactate dehydrogenase
MMKVVILVRILSRDVLHVHWMLHSPLYAHNVIIQMGTMDINTLERYAAILKMISIQITEVDVEHVSRCSTFVLKNHVYTVLPTPFAITVGG